MRLGLQHGRVEELVSRLSSVNPSIAPCCDARAAVRRAIGGNGVRLGAEFYTNNSVVFNRAYYLKNYIKSVLAIRYAKERGFFSGVKMFIDVAGGAGPSALAVWHELGADRIVLVDQSAQQITLARQITELFGFSCELRHQNMFSSSRSGGDVVSIISYGLCEQTREDLTEDSCSLLFGEKALIIDYGEILNNKKNILEDKYLLHFATEVVDVDNEIGLYIPEDSIKSCFLIATKK